MRTRLRALRTLILGEPAAQPLTEIILPVIEDGVGYWIDAVHAPSPQDVAWATHTSPRMREAYAIHAVTLARGQAVADGYEVEG